jgi:hypothetical protein
MMHQEFCIRHIISKLHTKEFQGDQIKEGEKGEAYSIYGRYVRKPEGKRLLERPTHSL